MNSVEMIPISKIRVLNPRSRGKLKFRDICDNILKIGLKKPITVSHREGDDGYDLVCGQGRLLAYIDAGATEIPALVVDISLEDRLLRSLVENLTKRTRPAIEMARDLIVLKKRGHDNSAIAVMVGVSEKYVSQLIRLMEHGEERLVTAVEHGEVPISVAVDIATADDSTTQRMLQTAYESGELRGPSLLKVRRLIEQRRARGKELGGPRSKRTKTTSTHDLMRALRKETQRQELLAKKSRHCEQQLRFVVSALKDLRKDKAFLELLRTEKLDVIPKHLNEMIQK
jgi:ParB family chromosome partitioning protein